jgi:signal transduction histidine kinase
MWQIPCDGARPRLLSVGFGLVLAGRLVASAAGVPSLTTPLPVITDVAQFQQWVGLIQQTNWPVRLEGAVCWSDLARGMIVLRDDSGTALVEMPPQGWMVRPGENISLEGIYGGSQGGANLRIGGLKVVEDCTHGMSEQSDEFSLKAGKYPISLSWVDGNHLDGLDVFYEGPNLLRQSISDSELLHAAVNSANGATNWVPGLNYWAYEGCWSRVPDFQKLTPVKEGITPNFDIGVRTRNSGVGLVFKGYLKIQQGGIYRFTLVPHGRRQLFVERPRLKIISTGHLSRPLRVVPGQILSGQEPSEWATVEGVITFVSKEQSKGLRVELSSDTGKMRVQIADGSNGSSLLLPGGRVRITGICRSTYTAEGQRIFGDMWTPDMEQVELLEVAPAFWASHPVVAIGDLLSTNYPGTKGPMVHIIGKVCPGGLGRSMIIGDGTGKITLQISQPLPKASGDYVQALGRWSRAGANVVLRNGFYNQVKRAQRETTKPLPVLTTAEQVKRLTRAEALRGYPVRLRGVVTWSGGSGVVLQDSTMGVFVDVVDSQDSGAQHIGEYWKVEGVTTDQFSPMVLAQRVVDLGLGDMPNPVHPTWDQLMNGTLDTEYVEIQGVATSIKGNSLTLLTHNGIIQVDLTEMQSPELKRYLNALISIQGCLWAVKNETTHVLQPGEVQIHNASISMDQTAPTDPFSAPLKRVSQLLLFDARASALERVRVEGQVIHGSGGEYDLMNGANGLEFVTRTNVALQIGDRVEVVGFPLLGGPVPILREAMVRRLGHAPLPAARPLREDALLNENYDLTLVKVKAQLASLNDEQSDQVLGLQTGSHMFIARLDRKLGVLPPLPIGSRLEVTGVYEGRGGDRSVGRAIDSFELLLNSPADVQVLARPSWWTLGRLLTMVGILVGFLAVALIWIGLLHRQVEQRTAQLKDEILVREQIEQQRVVEAERSRIARDLHDDLGSSLTEISMLADAGAGWPPTSAKASQRFEAIGDKARSVVTALDVIVWLVNPSKDVLPFLINYLGSYAEEYLSPSGIACRLKIPSNPPALRLTAQVRHNIFLAVKEALRNVVRHAHASEVIIEIIFDGQQLKIAIADNGQGFNATKPPNGNGLLNFSGRLASIGGQCQIASRPSAGTVITFIIPLPAN